MTFPAIVVAMAGNAFDVGRDERTGTKRRRAVRRRPKGCAGNRNKEAMGEMAAYRREIALVLLMILLIGGVWVLVNGVGRKSGAAQTEFVTDAVHNAALTCYAVEGAYPDDLEYLRVHYGLAYDQDRYLVRYDSFGSNLMPDISVTEVEASGS